MSYQLPSGQWVPEPGDVWTFDGLIWRPMPPLLVPGPRGGGGMGMRGPAGPPGPAGGANAVSVGEFQRLPGIQTTSSVVPVLYWSVPFVTTEVADILFQMTAVVFELPPVADPTNFMGFNFTAEIDGNPVPDASSFELNLQDASVNTSVETAPFQTYIAALPAGAHTIEIFWSANDVDNVILSGDANIAIHSI